MDLKLLDAEPTEAEREAIDAVVGAEATNGNRVARRDRTRRHLLLPALRAAQRRVGWVTPGALGYTSRRLDVPPADAYGVATFYALLALEERPAEVLHVVVEPRRASRVQTSGVHHAGAGRPAARHAVNSVSRAVVVQHGKGRKLLGVLDVFVDFL